MCVVYSDIILSLLMNELRYSGTFSSSIYIYISNDILYMFTLYVYIRCVYAMLLNRYVGICMFGC